MDNRRWKNIVLAAVLLMRAGLLFVKPIYSTDLERGLFYGRWFWDVGFEVYDKTPLQLDPTYNIVDISTHMLAWPDTYFDYGIINLMFYAIIATMPTDLAFVTAKLILNLFDLINFILLRRLSLQCGKKLDYPLIYLLGTSPLSALEGQVVSVTTFFMAGALYSSEIHNNKKLALVMIAIGFHWKYVPAVVAPHILMKNWRDLKAELNDIVVSMAVFILLWFPVLKSNYILSYLSFRGSLPVSYPPWNPLYLGPPFNFASVLLLVYISIVVYEVRHDSDSYMSASPFILLLLFLLLYRYAFPWYWVWLIPNFIGTEIKRESELKLFALLIAVLAVASYEYLANYYNISILIDRSGRAPF